jgi:hypothetical protein
MDQPEPADGWPDRPLTVSEAEDLHDDDVVAVWVMDHDSGVRGTVAPGADDDAMIDVVLETDSGFDMYSYTGGRWMDYGTQQKDDPDSPSMAGTLASYRILTGESTALEE